MANNRAAERKIKLMFRQCFLCLSSKTIVTLNIPPHRYADMNAFSENALPICELISQYS